MGNVRAFDGVDDRIILSGPNVSIFNGSYSVIVIAKPITLSAGEGYATFKNGGSFVAHVAEGGSGKVAYNTATTSTESGSVVLTADTWHIFGVTKATGSNQGKVHAKPLGSGAWAQAAGGDVLANIATNVDTVIFGEDGFGTFKDCRIAVVATFATQLSDADVQSIQTTPSTQKLADLGATHIWELNQASTATAVEDLVGTVDQSSITGTSVVTTDDPPGWTFGLGGGGGGGADDFYIMTAGGLVASTSHVMTGGGLYPPL